MAINLTIHLQPSTTQHYIVLFALICCQVLCVFNSNPVFDPILAITAIGPNKSNITCAKHNSPHKINQLIPYSLAAMCSHPVTNV